MATVNSVLFLFQGGRRVSSKLFLSSGESESGVTQAVMFPQ